MEFEREQVAILKRRLEEPPRTIQTLFGPRQSGKTTIVKQTLRTLAGPWRYYAVDSPDNDATSRQISQPTARRRSPAAPRDTNWLTEVWGLARADAAKHGGSVLVFDELQYIPDWSSTVKGLWDKDRWDELPLHVVILGSAPMSIQSSLNESMAGRFEVIDVRHWSFGEMKTAFGLDLDQYVYFGGNPGAMRLTETWPPHWRDYEPRWRRYVTTSLIEPAIEKDVLAMTRVDKPALIRRLFELGAAYSGQILPLHRMLGELQDAGNATTLARYLDLLSRIGLLTGLQKYSPSTLRIRNSPPKFNVLDTALMSVGSNRSFEDAKADRSFWGRLVESAVGAHLLNTCNPATRVLYWREASDEVDFVLQSGLRSVAIEVKTGSRVRSSRGMRIFKERFRPHRTLLVTGSGEPHGSIPLEIFLSRPASAWFRSEFVQRSCTEIGEGQGREEASKPLSDFDSAPAYVLLGDPGMGKTTSFREACRNLGEQAHFISARDFITLDSAHHPEWRRKTLFIDGLDEIRAGSDDARTPLDDVRRQLDRLGQPRFRLSCREADWLGTNDRERLEAVAPDGEVAVLRLHPLTDQEVVKVAESRLFVKDGHRFLDTAKQRGIGGLIRNPQSLELLAASVQAGEWPENRAELFEFACRHLVSEPNEEHLNAGVRRGAPDQLLEAAGRICSLLLLSGTAGVRLPSAAADTTAGYKPTDLVDPPPPAASAGEAEVWRRQQRAALSTRLFRAAAEAPPAERCFEPAHRHIAEFLAGRYLARQVEHGLPAARVVSIVTAGDGGVVTEHRGLSAWLAAHSQPARSELIERDPIGIGLYGDVSSFSAGEKRGLLRELLTQGPKLKDLHWRSVRAFVPLATDASAEEIHGKLTIPPREKDDQHSTEFLLLLLRYADPIPTLAEPILAILRGSGWWPRVRHWALDAFLRHCPDRAQSVAHLERLLSDVHDGRLEDPDNRIAGAALEQLYPGMVGPADVWGCLTRTRPSNHFGTHHQFWSGLAEPERSSDTEVTILLDTLPKYISDLRAVLDDFLLTRVAAELLVRGLETTGTDLTPTRLYDWLSAPVDCQPDAGSLETGDARTGISSWLEGHPDAYKEAFREGLRRAGDNEPPDNVVHAIEQRLYEAEPPDDFGSWCLDEAEALADSRPALARWLFMYAWRRFRQGEYGLSQARLDECVQRYPSWRPALEDPNAEEKFRDRMRKLKASRRTVEEEREQKRRQWLAAVRQEVPALRENRGAPWLLERLAGKWFKNAESAETTYEAWLGGESKPRHPKEPDQPRPQLRDWLREEFDPDEDLATAALQGLRGVLDRADMPEPEEILRLHSESRLHRLSLPFLAALHDRHREAPGFVENLTERQRRQALAVHYCVPPVWGRRPAWRRALIRQHPEVAASVLLPFARAELRGGSNRGAGVPVAGLEELAHDPDHAELAALVSLPLLRGFPVRGRATQLTDLNRLLWAALQYADGEELSAVVAAKLAARSMTVAQRVVWLGAAVIVDPHAYAGPLEEFVDGIEQRASRLAKFVWFDFTLKPKNLPPRALEALIRQFGRAGIYRNELPHSPDPSPGRLGGLIELLAAARDAEAAEALDRLANDESLSEWQPNLRLAIDRQTDVHRDASYERPELDRIRATLNNAAPANAADLAALALDRLDDLSRTIRYANTNDWRQFWNEDEYGRPTRPKREESCRDALLSHLERLLPAEVEAQPEGRYAADRRADIRLSCAGFHVPIEIKKQSHPALYRAARDQLVARYAQDPATGGHGILLALWFGDPEKAAPDDTGTRPVTPEELRQRLEGCLAKQLPPEQLRKIAVRVIDVGKP